MSSPTANKKTTTEFKIALLEKGFSVISLAQMIGKSRQAVSGVINGSDRFPKVNAKIQEVLNA